MYMGVHIITYVCIYFNIFSGQGGHEIKRHRHEHWTMQGHKYSTKNSGEKIQKITIVAWNFIPGSFHMQMEQYVYINPGQLLHLQLLRFKLIKSGTWRSLAAAALWNFHTYIRTHVFHILFVRAAQKLLY